MLGSCCASCVKGYSFAVFNGDGRPPTRHWRASLQRVARVGRTTLYIIEQIARKDRPILMERIRSTRIGTKKSLGNFLVSGYLAEK